MPKLEGDARIDYGIINIMKRKGYYNCRFVKALKNGARVYQMMDKNARPCSCIWDKADPENWVQVVEIIKRKAWVITMINLYEMSLDAGKNPETKEE